MRKHFKSIYEILIKFCSTNKFSKSTYGLLVCLHLLFLLSPSFCFASFYAGIGKSDLTPPIGTPSAGYIKRQGQGMTGVHDPLLASALMLKQDEKIIVFCSVDHLGFTYAMVQDIIKKVHAFSGLEQCEVFIGSSHTHSGGGAYLNIPLIGESLAGVYNEQTVQFYLESTYSAIIQAYQHLQPAHIGIGYGHAENMSTSRSTWPLHLTPLTDLTVIKVTTQDNIPLALFFNYPMHPTVLEADNFLFSADFVGEAREEIKRHLGNQLEVLYFNGAQAEIVPLLPKGGNRYSYCETIGKSLAASVLNVWNKTELKDIIAIETMKENYVFQPQATPFNLKIPVKEYETEINFILLDKKHVFITIPGELSCVYDSYFKYLGKSLGFTQVSILGLVNDAHGYIITPQAWREKTIESRLSLGGEHYGETVSSKIISKITQESDFQLRQDAGLK